MKRTTLLSAATPLAVAAAAILAVGDLNPPAGAVAATGKRLTEIEPRTPISAATTPGDADSVFRIAQPGSYYLTGNVQSVFGRSGLEIASSHVTIDLSGFSVNGSGSAVGSDGIRTSIVGLVAISILNGSVSNWSGDGIDLATNLADQCLVERIQATGNGGNGIGLGSNCVADRCASGSNSGTAGIASGATCTMTSCISTGNTAFGFALGPGCTLTSCTATGNSSFGFSLGTGKHILTNCLATLNTSSGFSGGSHSALTGCTANENTSFGFNLGSYVVVRDCVANGNGASGLVVGSDAEIRNCSVQSNANAGIDAQSDSLVTGCTVKENFADGIRCQSDSLILDNLCDLNGLGGVGAGILAASGGSRIEGNKCADADFGIKVNGAGNVIVQNSCSGNTTAWDIAANNVFGPILDRRAPASAAVLGTSAASSLGSTDANANFTH